MLYIGLALSLNGEESLNKLSDPDPDPDLHQNRISSSSSHTPPHVHQVSSESVHNMLRYPAHKQTNREAERGENISSSTFGDGGNYNR